MIQMTLFAMRTCTKCGIEKPNTDFSRHSSMRDDYNVQCKQCVSVYQRAYYERNKQEVIERSRKWKNDNRERFRENAAKRRKERYAHLIAYQRQWSKLHPEVGRHSTLRRRQRMAENAVYVISPKDFRRLYASACVNCGSTQDICLDHIIPLARGGSLSIGNAQPLCRSCNASKGALLMIEWKQKIAP